MTNESSPYCRLCGVLVDDDPEEFMVEGLCLTCNEAYQEGKKAADNVLREALGAVARQATQDINTRHGGEILRAIEHTARAALAGEKAK